MPVCFPGGNNMYCFRFRFGKNYEQQAVFSQTDSNKSFLIIAAMFFIVVFFSQRVVKDINRLGETDLVFLYVGEILFFIPGKPHNNPFILTQAYEKGNKAKNEGHL
jgi:hypothetical protein